MNKPIKNYEGHYEVSDIGKVISCKRRVTFIGRWGIKHSYIVKKREIRPWISDKGYFWVTLSKDGKVKKYRVSHLVAEAFLPNPRKLPIVMHKDNVRLNNNILNLKWGTQSENIKQAYKEGRLEIPITVMKGEQNPLARLTEKIVLSIRNSNLKGRELARIYNVTPSTICDIRRRRTWRHI